MDKSCTLSVIVPFHNADSTIEKCVYSIIKQMPSCSELILIDDHSSDNSWKICQTFSKRYARIFVYQNEEIGVSSARNLGISMAIGKWITFVDADDYIYQNYFSSIIKSVSNNCDFLLFSYDEWPKNRQDQKLREVKLRLLHKEELYNLVFQSKTVQGYVWDKVFKKKIIEEYQLRFNPKLSMNEDLVFCFEYMLHAKSVWFLDKRLYCYVKHGTGATSGQLTNEATMVKKSFTYMRQLQTICYSLSDRYMTVAYTYMNFFLLKKVINKGYDNLDSVKDLQSNIDKIRWNYFGDFNIEVKCLFILYHLIPRRAQLGIYLLLKHFRKKSHN